MKYETLVVSQDDFMGENNDNIWLDGRNDFIGEKILSLIGEIQY